MPNFRILVLSDLHIHQGKPNDSKSPSYLSSDPSFAGPKQSPIQDAIDLFQAKNLTADWIICPGDISDKNDSISARVAWTTLEELRRKTRARKLIGTIGNHDVDSRREQTTQRPDDSLKHLTPRFPFSDIRTSEHFWTNHHAVWKDSRTDATLVVLNTCALHGVAVAANTDPEHLRGYITTEVLDKLRNELPRKLSYFNVLVMHHHIQQHPWLAGDNSYAINGPLLVELLRETGVPWLVIHGHLHLPSLTYADADPRSPVVLSAGSVAAKTYPVRGKTARNQMYLIEFEQPLPNAAPPQILAKIYSWDWTPAVGWTEASRDSGLAWRTGFGYREVNTLAQKIVTALGQSQSHRLRWNELIQIVPEPQYLVPSDLDVLINLLEAQKISVDYDRFQVPSVFA